MFPSRLASPASRTVVNRVDHLYARVERPDGLFETLTKQLGLPRSYGFTRVPGFEGGAVSLGNIVFLEALRYSPDHEPARPRVPGFDGLALASPLSIDEAATELSRRGISHAPVVPFVGDPRPFGFAMPLHKGGLRETPGPLWSTVVLGGFLGDRKRARQFRFIPTSGTSRLARTLGCFQGRLLTSRRFGDAVMARSMTSDPTVWIQQFDAADMSVANAAAAEELAARGGGPLGLERVREVVLGARNLEREQPRWQRLLDPTECGPDGAWHFNDGPALRLVEDDADRIVCLVCEVTSVERAKAFLAQERMLDETEQGTVRVTRAPLQEMDIRLVEATASIGNAHAAGRRSARAG